MADKQLHVLTLAGVAVAAAAWSSVCLSSSQSCVVQWQPGRPEPASAEVAECREAAWERREERERLAWLRNQLHPTDSGY